MLAIHFLYVLLRSTECGVMLFIRCPAPSFLCFPNHSINRVVIKFHVSNVSLVLLIRIIISIVSLIQYSFLLYTFDCNFSNK